MLSSLDDDADVNEAARLVRFYLSARRRRILTVSIIIGRFLRFRESQCCVHAWWRRECARSAGGCHCANALVNLARGQRTPSPRGYPAPRTPGPIKRLPLQYIYFIIDVAGLRVRVGRESRANRIMHFCLFLHWCSKVIGK